MSRSTLEQQQLWNSTSDSLDPWGIKSNHVHTKQQSVIDKDTIHWSEGWNVKSNVQLKKKNQSFNEIVPGQSWDLVNRQKPRLEEKSGLMVDGTQKNSIDTHENSNLIDNPALEPSFGMISMHDLSRISELSITTMDQRSGMRSPMDQRSGIRSSMDQRSTMDHHSINSQMNGINSLEMPISSMDHTINSQMNQNSRMTSSSTMSHMSPSTNTLSGMSSMDHISPVSSMSHMSNSTLDDTSSDTSYDNKRGVVSIEEELVQQSRYKTELCRSWTETNQCRYGPKCQFAHGEEELRPILRHPKYKTELCRSWSDTGRCPYGNRCRFIHGKINLIDSNQINQQDLINQNIINQGVIDQEQEEENKVQKKKKKTKKNVKNQSRLPIFQQLCL